MAQVEVRIFRDTFIPDEGAYQAVDHYIARLRIGPSTKVLLIESQEYATWSAWSGR